MANMRTFKFPGIWAEHANTDIPSNPVRFTPYRNINLTATTINKGQNYGDVAKSSDYNQILYLITKFLTEIESQGIPSYSNLIDYRKGSICLGINDEIYICNTNNGPSSVLVNPVEFEDKNKDEVYWISLSRKINSIQNILELFNEDITDAGSLGNIITKLDEVNTKLNTLNTRINDIQSGNGGNGGNGGITDIVYKSSTYTITELDNQKLFICTGTFTITLPTAGSLNKGFSFYAKNNGNGTITVAGGIDGKTDMIISTNESVQLISDGANWVSLHNASWISN